MLCEGEIKNTSGNQLGIWEAAKVCFSSYKIGPLVYLESRFQIKCFSLLYQKNQRHGLFRVSMIIGLLYEIQTSPWSRCGKGGILRRRCLLLPTDWKQNDIPVKFTFTVYISSSIQWLKSPHQREHKNWLEWLPRLCIEVTSLEQHHGLPLPQIELDPKWWLD